jgi:toxin ParE1/3/4
VWVVFSDAAKSDLRQIALFIARDSPSRARSFVRELRFACEGLSENPYLFAALADYKNLRRRVVGNYLIIYSVDENQISIVHIVNGARDIGGLGLPE